jgi:hypothetical protein
LGIADLRQILEISGGFARTFPVNVERRHCRKQKGYRESCKHHAKVPHPARRRNGSREAPHVERRANTTVSLHTNFAGAAVSCGETRPAGSRGKKGFWRQYNSRTGGLIDKKETDPAGVQGKVELASKT